MIDVITCLQTFNQGRDPERLAMKFAKMRQSPFIFLRGSCHLFYDRLPASDALFKRAPATWHCGDLHLENFGSYKGDNRLVYFDINDFDEAVLAPATWDLVRFLTSVILGMEDLKLKRPDILPLCHVFLDSYSAALANGKARWVERETADGLVKDLLDSLQGCLRPRFLDSRTELKGKRRVLRIDGKKALSVSDEQRSRIESFIAAWASQQTHPQFFKLLDVARRIAGTGSLGVDRYSILVEGKGSPDDNYLLDLKQALPSALVPHVPLKQPAWTSEAERVVTIQRRMQAVSMAFLQSVRIEDDASAPSYILRGLQPSEDRVALPADAPADKASGKQLASLMCSMGAVVAWAQLRSSGRQGSAIADELIDFGQRADWQRPLLDAAEACATAVKQDWQTFGTAWDGGVFASASPARR
ncbi:DUF2252 domain-containing protein [Andreprevotia chitinilytica]|uniref:DUF2252 domain-containing protein n=1 Tax=Andreprevotia chitinilytica TaxID=396808 RepID=UPI0005559093|nr:DUF2252 domain-containing protein [Andreprevotia chitinilytica]